MDIRDTKLNRAVAQILEWTYGQTNIQFEIDHCHFTRVGSEAPDNHINYCVVTDTRRVSHQRHPGALAFEAVQLSMTGVGVDFDSRMDELLIPGDEDIIKSPPQDGNRKIAELKGLDSRYNLNLKADQGGFGTVSVQTILFLFDGGQKSISRNFIFRNNQMNQIR